MPEPLEPHDLHDRALGAYLGFAIGDALGATVEFMRPREIAVQYGVHRDIIGGGWLKLASGQVTDDTTMSLALGTALLQGGRAALLRHAQGDDTLVRSIGDAYVQWFKGKPVDCGNTCRRGILRYLHEGTLEGSFNPGDGGNGALMRNLPAVLATWGMTPPLSACPSPRPDLPTTTRCLTPPRWAWAGCWACYWRGRTLLRRGCGSRSG